MTKAPPPNDSSNMIVLVVAAVLAIAAGGWALSLRSENKALRAELAAARGTSELHQEDSQGANQAADAGTSLGTASGPNRLSATDRAAMQAELAGSSGPDAKLWLVVSPDPEAQALAQDMREVFSQAHWTVSTRPTSFSVRAGMYFFAADESPPPYAEAALKALQAVGYELNAGLGYRAFYEEKRRTDPSWRGFELAPDQSYVVVIGPR